MNKLLTLSIAETKLNHFNIIAMDYRTRKLVALSLSRKEIISPDGIIYWDIGKYTKVDDYTRESESPRNITYKPKNSILLNDQTVDLKGVLEDSVSSSKDFFDSRGNDFVILKAKKITDITYKKEPCNTKYYMHIVFSDNINANPIKILNKDYRWINYWNRVPTESFNITKEKYCTLFNRPGKDLYLILYRFYFPNGPTEWITGIHWI